MFSKYLLKLLKELHNWFGYFSLAVFLASFYDNFLINDYARFLIIFGAFLHASFNVWKSEVPVGGIQDDKLNFKCSGSTLQGRVFNGAGLSQAGLFFEFTVTNKMNHLCVIKGVDIKLPIEIEDFFNYNPSNRVLEKVANGHQNQTIPFEIAPNTKNIFKLSTKLDTANCVIEDQLPFLSQLPEFLDCEVILNYEGMNEPITEHLFFKTNTELLKSCIKEQLVKTENYKALLAFTGTPVDL